MLGWERPEQTQVRLSHTQAVLPELAGGQLWEALRAAIDSARYWQEPDGDDLLAARPAVVEGLGPVAERVAAGRARLRQVQAAIAALSPKLRDTLLLASSGDHAYDEIAAMLNVPVGTVKWRVAEARRLLNKELP